MSARFLCFDLATNSGWASCDGAQLRCGLWDLSQPFGKGRADKIDSFSRRLTLAVQEFKPTVIAAEAPLVPRKKSGDGASGLMVNMDSLLLSWGLFTYLELACRRLQLPLREVHNTAIKQLATGHGARWKDKATGIFHTPDKKMVLERMRFRYPHLEIASHDVADALAIATLLRAEQNGAGAPAAPIVAQPQAKAPARPRVYRGRRRASA